MLHNKCLSGFGEITNHTPVLDKIELFLSLLIRWEEAKFTEVDACP